VRSIVAIQRVQLRGHNQLMNHILIKLQSDDTNLCHIVVEILLRMVSDVNEMKIGVDGDRLGDIAWSISGPYFPLFKGFFGKW